jgi:hypothetical protein
LKRFYVHRHFAELSPELIWGSCVLVANKAEETKILPQHVAKKMGIPLASVVQFEIAVLDALRFHLQVFHPYRSLKAFFQLIKVHCSDC